MKKRLRFAKISEQMKGWSAALGDELLGWHKVTARNMFGMTTYYGKGMVFAALPRTRAFEKPASIAFKLYEKTPRVLKELQGDPAILNFSDKPNWIVMELRDEGDLRRALYWFHQSYRGCLSATSRPRKKSR